MQLREHNCAAVARLARRSGHPQLASRHGMELCVASWSRGILTISCKGSRRPTAGSAESSGADVIRRAQPARRRRRHSILDSGRAVTELPATPRNYQDAVEWKQDSTVVRFRDWLGAPALVSHWIVAVTPESVTVLEYPLAVDDALQLDIIVTSDGDLDGLSGFSFFRQPGL